MATNNAGLEVPSGADAFDPQGDMVDLADSLAGRIIVPVPNVTARSALVASLGWTPSVSRPLYVDRADAAAGSRTEVTYDGSTWITVGAGPAWVTASLAPGWALVNGALAPGYRVVGDTVYLRGSAVYAAGLTTAYVILLNSMPPVATNIGDYPVLGGVGLSRLGSGPSTMVAYLNPRSDGGIRVAASGTVGANSVVTLDGMSYRTSA